MRVGIATAQVPFQRDGAQGRAEELVEALRRAGHEAQIVPVPFNGRPECRLAEQMLACRLLDLEESMGTLIDRLIGLTFPAYLVPHTAKAIWLLRRCEAAYDLWGTPHATLHERANGEHLRCLVRDADARLIPHARGVFTSSRSAAERLLADCGIVATPLQAPPAHAERYRYGGESDFFLLVAPADSPLREEMVLQAMRLTHYPIRVEMLSDSGGPPAEAALEERIVRSEAAGEERRVLLGACLAVVSAPLGELDGVLALEAMLSEKAMITCNDTGGIAELVHDGQTGLVCKPSPEALADALDRLWEDRALARRLGRAARSNYQDLRLSWDKVLERLLA